MDGAQALTYDALATFNSSPLFVGLCLKIRTPYGLEGVLRTQSSLAATRIMPPPLEGALPFIDPNCFKVDCACLICFVTQKKTNGDSLVVMHLLSPNFTLCVHVLLSS